MEIQVLIVVQDRVFADALATWLDAERDMAVVAAGNVAPSPKPSKPRATQRPPTPTISA